MTQAMLYALGLLMASLFGAWVAQWFSKSSTSKRMAQVRSQGRQGESKAKEALEALGYEILEEQARLGAEMEIDGEKVPYGLIGDFLVEKDGVRSLVEVKTGAKAPDPSSSATRRQLLEYAVSFPVESIKLYDAERGELREVQFPGLSQNAQEEGERETSWSGMGWSLVVGGVLGFLGGYYWLGQFQSSS